MSVFFTAVLWLAAPSSSTTPPACPTIDHMALMAMDVKAFDQTLHAGWRVVGDVEGCEGLGADLIADYRNANAAALVNGNPQDIAGLNWHEAQLRATAGQTERAIRLFQFSRVAFDEGDALYGQATIAFLEHNHDDLVAARAALAALPMPPWFAAAAAQYRERTGQTATWPANLDVVDGFIACFDKPYREAYRDSCRPAPATQH
jgi:hypothetical protein